MELRVDLRTATPLYEGNRMISGRIIRPHSTQPRIGPDRASERHDGALEWIGKF